MCKINLFTHLDTSEETCVGDTFVFKNIGKNRMASFFL